MESIAKKLIKTAVVLLCFGQATSLCLAQTDLHSQAAAALLAENFSDPDLSFIVLDGSGRVVTQRWPDSDRPVPIGSLIKPFLALAYGRTHDSYPEYTCMGKNTCWLRRGHGRLGIREAIGFSCNSYFHQLVAASQPGFAEVTLTSFGLDSVSSDPGHPSWDAEASPLALAHAYLQLALNRQEPAAQPVLEGMALSAQRGTAKAIGESLPGISGLAKTGTAACTHTRKAPGDGFAVVIVPSDGVRTLLLVRLHGRPGSMAAAVAGRMLAALEMKSTNR